MDIEAYLDRIGYQGPRTATVETLVGVHRAQALAVPWENFDVQFQRPRTTSVEQAYEKVVGERRGGWCYELNGVLGWALTALGFKVSRIVGGPMLANGERFSGKHLALAVDLEGTRWIADVAGDASTDPYRLVEGPYRNRHYDFRLEALGDGWWRMHNHALGLLPFVDINPGLTDEALLSKRCAHLQTQADSPFVLNTLVLGQTLTGQASLRGRMLLAHDAEGRSKHLIESADEYVAVLARRFGLDLPQAAALWPGICARHDAILNRPSA